MTAYATADQLAAAVRVQVTAKNTDQLDACVQAASEEIDHELGRPIDNPLPVPVPALIEQVCIGRGVELWKAADAAFGALGFDATGILAVAPDTFARHAATLIPYKLTFGIA